MKDRQFRLSELIHGADYNPDQWLDMPDIIEEDFRLFPLAGMNSATVGIFSWNRLEPQEGKYCFEWLDDIMDRMADAGMKVILATPSGSRPAWMDRKYPEILRVSSERVRNLHGIRHNHCQQSPYYRKKTREMNRLLAERYGKHPALYMWHVSNEYQGECYCELICPQEGCEVLAVYTEDFYAGRAAVTRNSYQKGECWYIATRPEQDFLDGLYERIAQKQGMELIWGRLPEGIDIAVREQAGARYYFIMNFSGEVVSFPIPEKLKASSLFPDGGTAESIRLDIHGYVILIIQKQENLQN